MLLEELFSLHGACVDTYIDQVTTDKLSLVSRLKTSDDIVQNCSDEDILKMSANLKRKFIESIDDNGNIAQSTVLQKLSFSPVAWHLMSRLTWSEHL
jgi:hypothetical protein